MRENQGRGVGEKAEKEGTDGQKGEQRGGRDWRGKGEREWEETVTGASERGHRPAERDNELSCGPCRVRQVHLMTHLSV